MLKGPFIGPEAGGPTNYLPELLNFFNYDFSQSFYYQVFTEDKIQIFQDRIQDLKSLIY